MPHPGDRYTSEDVQEIIRRALRGGGDSDDVSYEELVDIAGQSGVSRERLLGVLEERERTLDLDEARELWKRRRKQKFFHHLRAYCIVNGFLFLMNLVTSPGHFWVVWPVLGWGIGLAFDASEAFFPKESSVERGARSILRKKQRRLDKAAYDGP
jgi:2TM domain-containing protein